MVTQLENEIVGEALVALRPEELKEMGVASMGHRLTILKGIYDVKIRQDISVEADHYIPPCMLRVFSTMVTADISSSCRCQPARQDCNPGRYISYHPVNQTARRKNFTS